jgi:nucleoside-diphosphate-sugar epimerase
VLLIGRSEAAAATSMYKDPRYDNSPLANIRRRFCGCLEPKPAGRFRRGPRYHHKKAALVLLAAFVAFLWYHTGEERHVTGLRGGGLGGTILIVGGFGFVGAAIAERALDQEYKVFVMDSSAAYDTSQPRNPLVAYIDSDDVPHHGHGGPFADAMEMIPNGVQHVIYAAGVQDSGEQHSIWDSTDGVRNVIEWCGERQVPDFLLMSSMEVCHLSAEELNADGSAKVEACTAPAESLLLHKKAGSLSKAARKALETEMVVESLCDKSDQLKCAVLRLSEPYGPGIEDGPIASIVAKVLADEPIDVPEVDVPRDYIHTDDVGHALMKTIRMGMSNRVLRLGICSGMTTSIETWARTAVETAVTTRTAIRLPSERENGPGMTCDVHRAWRKISFEAGVGLEEGIMTMLPASEEPDGAAVMGM